MPNPKWEVYENKATGIEYDLTDADAQSQLTAIKDGTDIDSFSDVESALSGYIAKSNTAGLVKNDGTIDTTKYASQNALGTVAKLFNSTASYTEGNYVIYNEELYQCETDHTGAWNASHFRKYLAGVANMLNSQYTQASTLAYPFSPDSNYKKGDYVVYFDGYVNLYYKFTQDHTGAWNASHVEQIKIFEELNDLRADAFPRSEQAVLGAKNWFNYTKETTSNNGVSFTNSNNQSCTLSGQATADQAAIEMGSLTVDKDTELIFNGASSSNNAKIHMYVFDSTTNARPYTDASKTTQQTNNCFGTGANSEIPFFAEAGHVIKVYARVQTTGTSVPNNTVFWPMISLDGGEYAPYAMTNKELTEKVQGVEDTVSLESGLSFWTINKVVKYGKVCTLNLSVTASTAITTSTLIGTLPTGFRPSAILYVPVGHPNYNAVVKLDTNGEITFTPSTGASVINICIVTTFVL